MPDPSSLDPTSRDQASSGPTAPGPRTEVVGTTIGRYRIRQKLGEGGFGTVYEAEQTEPVRRRVALKIIKLGMDTKEVVARFEAERQALALMNHAGIARVYDAGATDTGRPYFVMELVAGVPITTYCDRENLATAERLRLFVDVCHAVQHAHQKGIVHRDLKPSNVLVVTEDDRPVPKVIDFGIAKAISHSLTERTYFTHVGQVIGTPAYMSPEQAEASAIDVDTRTDIYSLGVLLYELLTGTTPFDPKRLRSAGFAEICRIIREVDPPRPSTRLGEMTAVGVVTTTGDAPTMPIDPKAARPSGSSSLAEIARHRRVEPSQLTRLLRRDLDWIVMRALEKSPARRYETANGFAMDVERYLRDEPVLATPPTVGYRARKFVRRHRGPIAALAVIAVALVAGVIGTTLGMVRAREAERTAIDERRSVERLLTFLIGDLKETLEPIGRLDAIDGAAQQVVAYYARRPADELDGADLLQYGQGLELVGKTQLSRAELDKAESAFREEVTLLEALRRREPGNTECLFWLSQAHFYLGAVAQYRDEDDEALAAFDRYLALAETLADGDPENPRWQLQVAYASSSRATALEVQGRDEEAAPARDRALSIKRRLVAADPADRELRLALANDLTFIADAADTRCDSAGAVAAAAEAHALMRDFVEAHPDDLDAAHRLNVARSKHAMYLADAGDRASALDLFLRNREASHRLLGIEPDNARWLHDRAVGLQLAGRTLWQLGRSDEALVELDASRRGLEQLVDLGSEPGDTLGELLATLRWTAEAELAAGRPERVAAIADAARARLAALPPEQPRTILAAARVDVLEARALLARDRASDAVPRLERALERLAPAPDGAPAVAETRATALLLLGRGIEAAPMVVAAGRCGAVSPVLADLARAAGISGVD